MSLLRASALLFCIFASTMAAQFAGKNWLATTAFCVIAAICSYGATWQSQKKIVVRLPGTGHESDVRSDVSL